MKCTTRFRNVFIGSMILTLFSFGSVPAFAVPTFGPDILVEAEVGDIYVGGYSVPSTVDWDNDGVMDLIVGEGSGTWPAKVRIYRNVGTTVQPQFGEYSLAQSLGGDLVLTGSGCMGLFPRVLQWDGDGLKDLLVGMSDGTIQIFLNVATDQDPSFDGGSILEVGPTGAKTAIDVGFRATPSAVDWDNDGKKDLVVGAIDGKIRLFLNVGTDDVPSFEVTRIVQEDGTDLLVPTIRSSPHVVDLDGDGNKDLVVGNTEGQILFYANIGDDESPTFSGYEILESNSIPIDLSGSARSRVFVCDWTNDGLLDLLFGGSDGKVHLCQGSAQVGIPGETVAVRLLPAYPNPFRSQIGIPVDLARPEQVRIAVYDISGRLVNVLTDGPLAPGGRTFSWSGQGVGGGGYPPASILFTSR